MTDQPAELLYQLGASSLQKLQGVDAKLVECVHLAITLTAVDFRVLEGIRTVERQKLLVAKGASKTMNSRHIPLPGQPGRAVDLGAVIDGVVAWDWPLYYLIADAMRFAAIEIKADVTWGGVWDRKLAELPSGPEAIEDAVAEYSARVRAKGGRPFIDGPHYQV
jgi:peptidoglycan LD-endopeptidase CwlK